MKKALMILGGLIVLALVGIQFVPVDRTNPPVTSDIKPPGDVRQILRTACYDCHSNETKWPWYSYIAPMSWRISEDVEHGRSEMNFSEWGELPPGEREHLRREIWEEVEEGHMPLPLYVRFHPAARLNPGEQEILASWSSEASDELEPGSGPIDDGDGNNSEGSPGTAGTDG